FQAEDGIRGRNVTGVQTCALPIYLYDYAIGLYKSVGGDMFTVSSDAHVAGDYQLGFEEAFNKLRNHDVNQLVVFQKGVPHYVDKIGRASCREREQRTADGTSAETK